MRAERVESQGIQDRPGGGLSRLEIRTVQVSVSFSECPGINFDTELVSWSESLCSFTIQNFKFSLPVSFSICPTTGGSYGILDLAESWSDAFILHI